MSAVEVEALLKATAALELRVAVKAKALLKAMAALELRVSVNPKTVVGAKAKPEFGVAVQLMKWYSSSVNLNDEKRFVKSPAPGTSVKVMRP